MPDESGPAKPTAYLFYAFLAYTLLLLVPVSFQPTMPYLDSSWGYDLNYFLHSRFRFGPDLIFTYGPLGFLNNPQHVAADIPIAIGVHALFWLAMGYQLISVWRSGFRAASALYCVSLVLGHGLFYDYWDYYVLAIAVITFAKLFRSSPSHFDLVLVPVLLGVSLLLKFTAFSIILVMLAAYAVHLFLQRSHSRRLAVWWAVCFVSGPLAYLIYNPSLADFVLYAKGSWQITSGFVSAMSLEADRSSLRLARDVCLILAFNIAVGLWTRRLFVIEALLVAFIVWNVFRHGFVRGDASHSAMFFGFVPLLFATLFNGEYPAKGQFAKSFQALSWMAFAILCLSGLSIRYPVLTTSNWWPKQTFDDFKLLSHPNELRKHLDHSTDSAFAATPGIALSHSLERKQVVVFPNGSPYVAKIDFQMVPVFTLQDYAANTPYLDTRGAQNLINADPPVDKVLLEWVAIDSRNLFLDTPAMSMALLTHFQLEQDTPGALLLNHRSAPLPVSLTPIDHQSFKAEEWVTIPLSNQLVAMSITLNQNLIGTLVTSLYRQRSIYMDLKTDSGEVRHYRVPPQNLATPGLINYVPQSLEDWKKLWSSDPLPNRIVKLRLTGPGLRWTSSSGYYFYRVEHLGSQVSN